MKGLVSIETLVLRGLGGGEKYGGGWGIRVAFDCDE